MTTDIIIWKAAHENVSNTYLWGVSHNWMGKNAASFFMCFTHLYI